MQQAPSVVQLTMQWCRRWCHGNVQDVKPADHLKSTIGIGLCSSTIRRQCHCQQQLTFSISMAFAGSAISLTGLLNPTGHSRRTIHFSSKAGTLWCSTTKLTYLSSPSTKHLGIVTEAASEFGTVTPMLPLILILWTNLIEYETLSCQ